MPNSSINSQVDFNRKVRLLWRICFLLLTLVILLTAGCSAPPAYSSGSEPSDRFARAEQYGQFVMIDKSVDCKGTKVTIEKALMDKTHTFMIAAVDGDIKGRMDYLCVDLFDAQGRELGRSTFSQKLPDGKTLLTFDAVQKAPEELRLEFFGGPVGYGEGKVVLTLKDINFKIVDEKYTKEYPLNETVEKKGYRVVVDPIKRGISETGIHYKLSALGDYDGIEHGWLYNYYQKNYPQILFMSASGRNLELHLSSPNSFGPSYRVSRDRKTMVGRAYFDGAETNTLQVKLTNIYGYYRMNEIIPLDGVKDKLDINRKLPVNNYIVDLKSFSRGNDESTWILDYSVLDSVGNKVDAAIVAGIYMKADNYRRPYPILLSASPGSAGGERLVFNWQTLESKDGLIKGEAIKITKLGIRQVDAVVNINLNNPNKAVENRDGTEIMAAVNEYYDTFGRALKSNDITIFAQKYGYLKPTGEGWDGVNDWQRHFQVWSPLGVKDYSVSFNDPILTISGNMATADIAGLEKILRNGDESGAGFSTVFTLEKAEGKWKITKVDELTEDEIYGVH